MLFRIAITKPETLDEVFSACFPNQTGPSGTVGRDFTEVCSIAPNPSGLGVLCMEIFTKLENLGDLLSSFFF